MNCSSVIRKLSFSPSNSRAILCYLVNKYAEHSVDESHQHLYPKDPELRANVDRMLFFDSGSLYKNVIDFFVSSELITDQPYFENKIAALGVYDKYFLPLNHCSIQC